MIVAIYVDHELMDPMKNERESDVEEEEKNIILVLMHIDTIIFVLLCY